MVFLTLAAAIIIANKTKKDPKLAAKGSDQLDTVFVKKNPPKSEDPKIKMATPKLAPEEIPNTKGPANGFLNSVCINNPQIDKPEPTKIAVIALGNLKCKTIVLQLSLLTVPPNKLLKMAFKGIETEPKLMFRTKKIISKTDKPIKCFL